VDEAQQILDVGIEAVRDAGEAQYFDFRLLAFAHAQQSMGSFTARVRHRKRKRFRLPRGQVCVGSQ